MSFAVAYEGDIDRLCTTDSEREAVWLEWDSLLCAERRIGLMHLAHGLHATDVAEREAYSRERVAGLIC